MGIVVLLPLEIHLKRFHPKVVSSSGSTVFNIFECFFSLKRNLSTDLDLGDEKHWTGKESFIIGVSQDCNVSYNVCVKHTFSEVWRFSTGFKICLFIAFLKKKKDFEKYADSSA